jgi:hypothetical protein
VAGWGLTNEIQNGKSYMEIFWDIVENFWKNEAKLSFFVLYYPFAKNNKTKGGQRPNALQKVYLP